MRISTGRDVLAGAEQLWPGLASLEVTSVLEEGKVGIRMQRATWREGWIFWSPSWYVLFQQNIFLVVGVIVLYCIVLYMGRKTVGNVMNSFCLPLRFPGHLTLLQFAFSHNHWKKSNSFCTYPVLIP